MSGTRVVVPAVARRITAAVFTAAGLPTPTSITRVGHGVILDFAEDLDKPTRRAVVNRCQATDDDTADLKEQAAATLALLQTFLDTVPAPDQATLDQARTATAAFLASPPVVAPTPDQANVQSILNQVAVLSRAFLADRSTTQQTRRLTRVVSQVIRIMVRKG